jgi:hypothetical protein
MAGGKSGIGKAKARQSSHKSALGINARQKAGLPAKSGRRRSPNIRSEVDRHGKRNWVTATPNEVHANNKKNHQKSQSVAV